MRDPGGLTASVPMSVTVINVAPIAVGRLDRRVERDAGGGVGASTTTSTPTARQAALTMQNVPATFAVPQRRDGHDLDRRVAAAPDRSRRPVAARRTFSYTVHDGDGAESAPATVTVVGPALNVAPIANDQTIDVTVGTAVDLVLDVSDPDSDPLTVIDVIDPAGVIGAQVGLTLVVVPVAAGTFQVTYRVSDGIAQSRVATVTINATAAAAADDRRAAVERTCRRRDRGSNGPPSNGDG